MLTAEVDGYAGRTDAELLDRALELGRVVFTQDADFLALATERMAAGEPFATVVYGHQLRVTIGQTIADLELISGTLENAELQNEVIYLPL